MAVSPPESFLQAGFHSLKHPRKPSATGTLCTTDQRILRVIYQFTLYGHLLSSAPAAQCQSLPVVSRVVATCWTVPYIFASWTTGGCVPSDRAALLIKGVDELTEPRDNERDSVRNDIRLDGEREHRRICEGKSRHELAGTRTFSISSLPVFASRSRAIE